MFTTVFIAHSEAVWHVESTPGLLLTIIALLDSAPLIVGKVIVIVLWGPVLCPLSADPLEYEYLCRDSPSGEGL